MLIAFMIGLLGWNVFMEVGCWLFGGLECLAHFVVSSLDRASATVLVLPLLYFTTKSYFNNLETTFVGQEYQFSILINMLWPADQCEP